MKIISCLGGERKKHPRTQKLVDLLNRIDEPVTIFLTGGVPDVRYCLQTKVSSEEAEADRMERLLKQYFFSSCNTIVKDTKALDTFANVFNTWEYARSVEISDLTFVTDPYHINRVNYICNEMLPEEFSWKTRSSDYRASTIQLLQEKGLLCFWKIDLMQLRMLNHDAPKKGNFDQWKYFMENTHPHYAEHPPLTLYGLARNLMR